MTTRAVVRYFISYAHADQRLADDLVRRLQQQLIPSRTYEHRLWRDDAILAGERWRDEIAQAVAGSDLGLLLLSPAFLGSEFITSQELPHFVNEGAKPIVPVMLKPINLGRHDLKGLKEHQLYRLDRKKAYSECRGDAIRSRFAEELFVQIESRLDRLK